MKSLAILFVLLLLPLSYSWSQKSIFTEEERAWIEAHPVIRFGYEPNWPPYEMYENGRYKGIVNDYLQRISKETGITFEPIPDMTWDESLNKLKSGEIHFVPSCAVTEKRKEFLSFSKVFVSDPIVIVTRKDANFISGLPYMKGKRVALPKNYYTQELLKRDFPKIKIIEKDKITDCLDAVNNGEAYAFMGSLGVVSYYINHKGYTNLKIAAPTDYEDVQIAMACTKDWEIFTRIADKVLNKITIDEHNKIRQKWISVRFEYGYTEVEVVNYVLIGVGIIILLAAIFFIWNWSLKLEIRKRKKAEKELSASLEEIQRQSEDRKLLLQEIHHRVKNNLQIISSMLKLQAASSEDEDHFDIDQTIDRINSISLIHEMIYQSESIHIDNIEMYVQSLVRAIIQAHGDNKTLDVDIKADNFAIGLKTLVPFAIIVNELVINSLKHGLKQQKSGVISMVIQKTGEDTFEMSYSDSGTWVESEKKGGFGSSLIEIFTEQLDGTFQLETKPNTLYTFQLKRQD